MEVSIKEFGKDAQEFYGEVREISDYDILIIQDKNEVSDSAKALQTRRKDGVFIIYIKEKDTPDYVIIHELFHVYFILKGYPQYFHLNIVDENMVNIASYLHNSVIHRIMIEEQLKRKMDLSLQNKENIMLMETIIPCDGDNAIDVIREVVSVVGLYFECSSKDVLGFIEKRYPNTFSMQKEIIDIIEEKEELSPFHAGRTVTKLYKKMDEFCIILGEREFGLHRKIMVEPVLTDRQLGLRVDQVFDLYRENLGKGECESLFLKSNGQNAIYLKNMTEEEIRNIRSVTVEEFYNKLKIKPLTK